VQKLHKFKKKETELLTELKETIKILGKTLKYKELTDDESKGLLKIIYTKKPYYYRPFQ